MRKPNLIIIYSDDLGYGDVGCYGSEVIKTPHIDELAQKGVRFTNWYSNSPVCSPSRASLLTGRYPGKTGVSDILHGKRGMTGLPSSQETIAKRLKSKGYKTAMFGKWHLGMALENSPNAHGFDEFLGFKAGCVDYFSHIYYFGQNRGINPAHDLWHNEQEVWLNGEYLTEVITERVVRFINEQQEEPFFLYIPYNAPHYPMHAPEKYMKRYEHLPWARQVMAAMITAMDDGIGEIISALKSTGQYENTVIFFSSDNGPSVETRNWLDGNEELYHGGSAGIFRGYKASLLEGGIREPAILSYPGRVEGGQVCDQVGVMMDVFPTFLELAELEVPEHIDGKSLVPTITESKPSPHQQVFWEYNGQLAVRQGVWKLVLNGKFDFSRNIEDDVHLSNLEKDPGEKINLKDEYPELVSKLVNDVQNWYESLKNGEVSPIEVG